MNTVSSECGEADRVEPEEDFLVDSTCFVGNFALLLVLPPYEDECDVGCDCRDDYEHRVFECGRRGGAHDYVSDDSAARCSQER